MTHHALGPLDATRRPVAVAGAGLWQPARSTGAYTLVGCTVGPGLDFADFQLLRDDVAATARLRETQESFSEFI